MNDEIMEDFLEVVNANITKTKSSKLYDKKTVKYIQYIYIIGLFLWIALLYVLDILSSPISYILAIIPAIIFAINFSHISNLSCQIEKEMFKGNFLSFGFLITVILINWKSDLNPADKQNIFKILVIAFVLLMFSLIDIWVCQKQLSIIKHVRTILQTLSITLLALSLYLYYTYQYK